MGRCSTFPADLERWTRQPTAPRVEPLRVGPDVLDAGLPQDALDGVDLSPAPRARLAAVGSDLGYGGQDQQHDDVGGAAFTARRLVSQLRRQPADVPAQRDHQYPDRSPPRHQAVSGA